MWDFYRVHDIHAFSVNVRIKLLGKGLNIESIESTKLYEYLKELYLKYKNMWMWDCVCVCLYICVHETSIQSVALPL